MAWGRDSEASGGRAGRVSGGWSQKAAGDVIRGQDFIQSAAEAKQGRACPTGFLERSLGCWGGVDYGGQRAGGSRGRVTSGRARCWWPGREGPQWGEMGRLGVSWLGGALERSRASRRTCCV